jgi:OOP family OmpA-OmpF porin
MKSSLHIASALALTAVLATGCGVNRFQDDAAGVQSRGTAFDNALASNYRKLSDVEYSSNDQKDGDTYALRSMAAAQGRPTAPDDLTNRRIPSSATSDVASGRQRLVAALDKNGRTSKPDVAAYAQASYDCWVEQLDENIQPDDIAACRDAFMKSLAELEKPVAVAPPPVKPSEFLVFFDWDKYNITAEAQKIIVDATNAAKAQNAKQVRIVGHTDTSGSAAYNLRLSERRAQAVAASMIKLGIPATSIVTVGRGQEDLLVPTPDNVREPQNRRAAISFPKMGAHLDNKFAIGIDLVN